MPRRTLTVAEQFIEVIRQAGVKQIYGLVGDSLNPIVDAVRRTDGIEWVHVHNEEAAAFAAGAEAQLTGRLAVCAGSAGPGNTHLVQGLYDAHRSGAPVLALASHIPSAQIGTGFFQETHPEKLFDECSHYCELIGRPEQMPRVLADRDPARARPGRGGGGGDARRRCASSGRTTDRNERAGRPARAAGARLRPRSRRWPRPSTGRHRDAVRRSGGPRRARRGDAARRQAALAGRSCARRQGVDPVRQPLRRRHERAAGLRGLPRGHARRPTGWSCSAPTSPTTTSCPAARPRRSITTRPSSGAASRSTSA